MADAHKSTMIIRLLNWNIQQLGATKLLFGDIVYAIARTIVESQVDIAIILEGNTTDGGNALAIAARLRHCVQWTAAERGTPGYTLGVISPNTGREFYMVVVRDPAVTTPLVITSGPNGAAPPATIGEQAPLEACSFASIGAPPDGDPQVLPDLRFPLIEPDLRRLPTSQHAADWPGQRRPMLAMFRVNGRVLPVFACHYIPNAVGARAQLESLYFIRYLRRMSEGHSTTLRIDDQPVDVSGAVLTGDFNIDACSPPECNSYAWVTADERLGMTPMLPILGPATSRTLLATPRQLGAGDMARINSLATEDLRSAAYDNFFVRGFPPVSASVIDIVARIRAPQNYIVLNEAPREYASLDQKGFRADPGGYAVYAQNAPAQLANTSPARLVNNQSALVGARLISDHLPVLVELDV